MARLIVQESRKVRRLHDLYVTAIDVHGDRFGIEVSKGETVAVLYLSRLEAIAMVASLRDEIGYAEEIRESEYRVQNRGHTTRDPIELSRVG